MTNTWNVESLMQMSTVIWRSGKNKCWVDNLRAEYLETDSTGLYVIIEKTFGFTIAADLLAPSLIFSDSSHLCFSIDLSF